MDGGGVAEAAGVRCNRHLQREAARHAHHCSWSPCACACVVHLHVYVHVHVQHLQREAACREHIEYRRRIRRKTMQKASAEGGRRKAAGSQDDQGAIT